jgi:hypothetical protein
MSRTIKVDTNSVIVDNDASTSGEHFIKLMLALLVAQDVSYEYASDSRFYNINYDASTGLLTWEDRNDPGTKNVTIQNPGLVGMLRESFGKATQDYPSLEQIRSVVREEVTAAVPSTEAIASAVSAAVPNADVIAAVVSSNVPTLDQITEVVEDSTTDSAKREDVRVIGRQLIEHDNHVIKHFLQE